MTRWASFFGALLVVAIASGGTRLVAADSKEDLKARVDDLTRRVEALERAAAAPKAPAAPVAATAPSTPGKEPTQQDALALYAEVDRFIAQNKMEDARKAMDAFEKRHPNTKAASWMRSLAGEMTVIGKAAPASWSIDKWLQGESDVVLDGQRPTVLVFWEEWCGVCRNEIPRFQKVWETYRPRGVQIVGVTKVTRTATEESVQKFVADSNLTFPIAKENGGLSSYFGVKPIPAAAVVKGGKIVWCGHPMRLTDEILSLLL